MILRNKDARKDVRHIWQLSEGMRYIRQFYSSDIAPLFLVTKVVLFYPAQPTLAC